MRSSGLVDSRESLKYNPFMPAVINRNFFIGTGFILLLLQTSCSTQRAIGNYFGDGEIFAMPGGGLIRGGGGYQVRFKRVRLDHPAHLTYRFIGLPNTERLVNVCFVIEDSRHWERRRNVYHHKAGEQPPLIDDLGGTLAMSLKDEDGNVILEFQHKLSEFSWSGSRDEWWLEDSSKSGFKAKSRTKYILEVSIEPDAILKDIEGYVLFRSGANEGLSIGF